MDPVNERPGPALGYSEADGVITLRMMPDDWQALLMCLGCAGGNPSFERMAFRLANRLNRGNRAYTPYELPDEPAQETPAASVTD